MSEKMSCPACDCYTSYLVRGEDCPNCGLSAEVAYSLERARKKGADEKLIQRCASLESAIDAHAKELSKNRRALSDIRDILARLDDDE